MIRRTVAAALALAAAPVAAPPAPIVGQPAPAFSAQDSDGKAVSLGSPRGWPVVLEWPPSLHFVFLGLDPRTRLGGPHAYSIFGRADAGPWIKSEGDEVGEQAPCPWP